MSSDDLKKKLAEYHRKKILSNFEADLAHKLDLDKENVKVLNLQESRELRDQWKKLEDSSYRHVEIWYENQKDRLKKFLNDLKCNCSNLEIFLTRRKSWQAGLVRTDLHTILDRAMHLIDLDGEMLLATNRSGEIDIQLVYETDYIKGVKKYEIILSGEYWKSCV